MRAKYRCKKCKDEIGRKTWFKTRLCRACWLANKTKKCRDCKTPIHKTNTQGKCRTCYLRKYCRIRNQAIERKTKSHSNCIECNKRLKRRFVKYCSQRCSDRYKKLKRRAAKANALFLPVCRQTIYDRDNFRCYICQVKVATGGRNNNWRQATIDHVVPLNLGGHHAEYNLRCCCRRCNSKKNKRLLSEHLLIIGLEAEAAAEA